MSLVIPDEFLKIAHISEADLKLEIAILLFQKQKLTVSTASKFAGINRLEFQQTLASRQIYQEMELDTKVQECDRIVQL